MRLRRQGLVASAALVVCLTVSATGACGQPLEDQRYSQLEALFHRADQAVSIHDCQAYDLVIAQARKLAATLPAYSDADSIVLLYTIQNRCYSRETLNDLRARSDAIHRERRQAERRAAGRVLTQAALDAEAARQMGAACNPAEYEAARLRLLSLLDEQIAEESEQRRIDDLIRERDQVRRMRLVCDPQEDILDEVGQQPRAPGGRTAPADDLGVVMGERERQAQLDDSVAAGTWAAAEVLIGGGRNPSAGIGVRRDGPAGAAPERFAGDTDRSLQTWSLEGALQVEIGGAPVRLFLRYTEGQGDNGFACPVGGGVDCGIVYGDNAPSGSSGIIAPFGLNGTTEVESTTYGARAEVDLFGGCGQARSCGASLTGYGYADYSHEDRDHHLKASGSGMSTGFTFDFSQTRDQEIQEDRFGAGLGLRLDIPLRPRLSFTLDAAVGAYYRTSELHSIERNTSNFGPASDRDFTLNIADSGHGFGLQYSLQPGVRFWATPSLSVSLGAFYRYAGRTGAVFNPSSGDQVFSQGLSTRLSQDSQSFYGGFLSLLGVF